MFILSVFLVRNSWVNKRPAVLSAPNQGYLGLLGSLGVATTAVRSLTRTCRIWRSDASGEASGR